ncbi:MAG TPA: DUF202 domain-containing protein [Acidimicrobiales bacterium]|nr:DUF202 domain-containing protein [Acidimicrobiales bacterium]
MADPDDEPAVETAARRRAGLVRRVLNDPRDVGEHPDYRFTLANERTFLAWIRTALALAAGGLGIVSFIDNLYGKELLGLVLLGLSFVTSATSYRRWAANERSMRLDEPLPTSWLPLVIAVGTGVIGIAAAIFFAATEF